MDPKFYLEFFEYGFHFLEIFGKTKYCGARDRR
jgi:hypothetical protein